MMRPEVKALFKERKTSALRVAREIGITHTYMYALLRGFNTNHGRRVQIARKLRVPLTRLAEVCGWELDGKAAA